MTDIINEAIQKAVEALGLCYEVCDWPANGTTIQDKALEGLRTYQSELEALKAENAELRRAVVDLAYVAGVVCRKPEYGGSCIRIEDVRRLYDKHSSTIAKAKAVQNV